MTIHEKAIWERLKGNQILELRFKSQHPIDKYIADFYCHRLKLVIEIDGKNHTENNQSEYDIGRTEDLNHLGITVIRFTNEQIDGNLDKVVNQIEAYCESKLYSDPKG